MNKIFLLLFLTCILIGCNFDKEKASSRTSFKKDDRQYKLECIDRTLRDTIVAISINLVNNSARIKYSSRVEIGVSVELISSEFISIYAIGFYKLKKPIGGDYSIVLDGSECYFPKSLKSSTKEELVCNTLQFVKTKGGIEFTDELAGAEAVRKTLFEFDHFPELEEHSYTISESYQDSKSSEVVTIVQTP